jgi:hypothetical protein
MAYSSLHKYWNERIYDAAARLVSLEPTLLLSNIPYLSIAAASKAGIPAIAMSSLNWADVFYHYCAHFSRCKSNLATDSRCVRYGAYVFASCARNADAKHS